VIPYDVLEMLRRLRARFDRPEIERRMLPSKRITSTLRTVRVASRASIESFWRHLIAQSGATESDRQALADPPIMESAAAYRRNIENLIGCVKVPLGVIGPLRINGLNAVGDYAIPMATTEAALVASYARGANAANRAGGVTTAVLSEGMTRSPAFVFDDLLNAGLFVDWVCSNAESLKAAAESTTRYGKLIAIEPMIDNEVVFLICRFTTGDASGQNMVTIAAEAICNEILAHCPVPHLRHYIEGNFSGDKKGSFLGTLRGRGRKVSASVVLPASVVEKVLRTTVEDMLAYARVANLGASLSGQIGAQAHYANGLAALYIATGQDAAGVAESAVGFTRLEARGSDLFCSVTMPNVLVGAVGGGTGLPSQAAALHLLGLPDEGKGAALAEVAAALCLCGEISIVAAIAAGHFVDAHRNLARER
jgi:hydroxymethylglutaryl-CoA reductase (NADPH)